MSDPRFVLTSDMEVGSNRLIIVLLDTQLSVVASDLMEVEAGMKSAAFIKEYNERVSKLVSSMAEFQAQRVT